MIFPAKCISNEWVEDYPTPGKNYAVSQFAKGEPDDEIWFLIVQTDKGKAGSFNSTRFEYDKAELARCVECKTNPTHQDTRP